MISASLAKRLKSRYGPWAVVTGASSGIGLSMARALGQAGFKLFLVSRSIESSDIPVGGTPSLTGQAANDKSRATYLAQIGAPEVIRLSLDLTQSGAVEALEEKTSELDVGLYVASAGFGTSGPFIENDLKDEQEMLQLNCMALMSGAHTFARRMKGRGRGGIILMSSMLAYQGVPGAANYAATKAYVHSLAEGLHHELKPHGIDVLASAPGPTSSGFAKRAGMQMDMAMEAESVVLPTLKALGRRTVVEPGLLTRFLRGSLMTLPRSGKVWALSIVMKGMTKHQKLSH